MEKKKQSLKVDIKDLLPGMEFKDAALAQKVSVHIDPIINEIMKDANDILQGMDAAQRAGIKDKNTVKNLGTIEGRIRSVLAKHLQMDPNDKRLEEVLGAKLNPEKVDMGKIDPKMAKKIQEKEHTFLDVLADMQKNFMDDKTAEIVEQQKKDVRQNEVTDGSKQGKKSDKRETGGGSVGFDIQPVGPSYRGLDCSRISKMVEGMFKDIQTMGFVAGYLEYERKDESGNVVYRNSPGWHDIQEAEKENIKKRAEQAKKIQEDEEKEAQAAQVKREGEEETAEKPSKLTTPTLKKNGKELAK